MLIKLILDYQRSFKNIIFHIFIYKTFSFVNSIMFVFFWFIGPVKTFIFVCEIYFLVFFYYVNCATMNTLANLTKHGVIYLNKIILDYQISQWKRNFLKSFFNFSYVTSHILICKQHFLINEWRYIFICYFYWTKWKFYNPLSKVLI